MKIKKNKQPRPLFDGDLKITDGDLTIFNSDRIENEGHVFIKKKRFIYEKAANGDTLTIGDLDTAEEFLKDRK